MTAKVPKDEICPKCDGFGRLCTHPDADGDGCPVDENRDGCIDNCEHEEKCSYCKGEGMVTFAKMERHIRKISNLKWGERKHPSTKGEPR